MARILYGTEVRDAIAGDLKRRVALCSSIPTLAIIQVGDRDESNAYILQKKKFATSIGAGVRHVRLPVTASTEDVVKEVRVLNADSGIAGIIVQLPLPQGIDLFTVIEAIDPAKDVDGLTAYNMKLVWSAGARKGFVPATAKGILMLLQHYGIAIAGKHAVVIGRSMLVGKPCAALMLAHDATVTVCHTKTADLASVTRTADILIVAAGSPSLIGERHVKAGQVVIDVGITSARKKLEDEIEGASLRGDVDSDTVASIVGAISPVPGGVGPMTVAALFTNLIEAVEGGKAVRI